MDALSNTDVEAHKQEAADGARAGSAGAQFSPCALYADGATDSDHSPIRQGEIFEPSAPPPSRGESGCAAEIFVAPALRRGGGKRRRESQSLPLPEKADQPARPIVAQPAAPSEPVVAADSAAVVRVAAGRQGASALGTAVAEQRFLTLAAHCDTAVLMLGPDNDVRFSNAAARRLFANEEEASAMLVEGAIFPLPLARRSSGIHKMPGPGGKTVRADISGTWWKDHPEWMACVHIVPSIEHGDVHQRTTAKSAQNPPAATVTSHVVKKPAPMADAGLNLSCFTTTALVGEARRCALALLGGQSAQVRVHIAALPTLMLCADQARLARGLGYILANALRYARSCVTLSIYCHPEQGLEFHILDDGPGFTAASHARASEIYKEISASATPVSGLAYAADIFIRHEGALHIQSAADMPAHIVARLPVHCLLNRPPAARRAITEISSARAPHTTQDLRKPEDE